MNLSSRKSSLFNWNKTSDEQPGEAKDCSQKKTLKKMKSGSAWISKTFHNTLSIKNKNKPSKTNKEEYQSPTLQLFESHTDLEGFPGSIPVNKVNTHHGIENYYCSSSDNSDYSHEKDIVPLRQFLRYSVDRSDQRTFQRRRFTQPSQPKYEVEWQKDQWLQLDEATNKQIEKLRKNGFSKIAIRKDSSLNKYILYNDPCEIDVQLEISLHDTEKSEHISERQPITCHQPSRFCLRRTHWWHTSYKIGEAQLPNWVDTDLCCNAVVMDPSSVMAAMTNLSSRASISSFSRNENKLPDTPAISQRSSVHQLKKSTSTNSFLKPLQYSDPPFLLEKDVLSSAAAQVC